MLTKENKNIEDLGSRLAKDETEASFAIFDMLTNGAIYQHQGNYEYYMVNSYTGHVIRLDRHHGEWEKQIGLSFKFMYATKWRKVIEK